MLIDHDFDWEADLEESPRPGVDRAPANGRGPDSVPHRPVGPVLPSEQVIIIERRRGFSRATLILALVALALSAISRIPKNAHPLNATVAKDHPQIRPERNFPARAGHPNGGDGMPLGKALEQSAWPREFCRELDWAWPPCQHLSLANRLVP